VTRIQTLIIATAAAAAACTGRQNVQCEQDSNCDLSGGGVCTTVAETNNRWCAYPDPQCESGYRFSDFDVGDGVGNQCVPDDGVTEESKYTLTVNTGGSGSGGVTSEPPGLLCTGSTCSGKFDEGTIVTLSAVATSGVFLGWSDGCTGQGMCVQTMDKDHSVSALFGMPGEGLWATQFGGAAEDFGTSIAIDSEGNIVAAGRFAGSMTVGATTITSAGSSDVYVAKLDGNTGELIWLKSFGGPDSEEAKFLAVDASDDIYIAGEFSGTANFGGGTLTSAGASDVFALKLTQGGAFSWAQRYGGTNFDNVGGIAVRGSSVVVAANFLGSVTTGSVTHASAGSYDVLLVSSTLNGAIAWSQRYGGAGTDVAADLAVDGSGNIVVGGRFNGTSDFGGGSLTSAGNFDALMLKVSGANGAHLMSKRFGSTGYDTAGGVAVDVNNNILLSGSFNGTVDFGLGALTASETNFADVFLAKYSVAGAAQWAKRFGGASMGHGRSGNALAVNASGDVAITGTFDGTISFGGTTLSSAGSTDLFAARFSGTDGTHLNSVRAGGSSTEAANSITQSSTGRFFVTGSFNGFSDFGGQALTTKGGNDGFVLALAPL